ncbi:MAG TPA: cell division protein ZapA, partial [Burkholderiaceae bacterium]|nr:cell division protein ZapA [Burkholderiaceae bacterium]
MKQVEVTILGQSYLLMCPEGGETLLQAAVAAVDREMSGIRDAGKVRARERMAVLAALNLAYRLAENPRGGGAATHPGTEGAHATVPTVATDGANGVDPAAGKGAEDTSHLPHAEASEARRAAAAQVDMLIARLDAALSEDGRL